ncbi:MAG: aa3-type cytochrome oxidase subunit IV, partial [Acidimicrobiia bacterium]
MTDHLAPGTTEGPAGHEARPPTDDRKVPWRVFLAIGAGIATLGVIYWATAYEEAGVVMLVLASVVALWIAVYLWLHQRSTANEAGATAGSRPAGVDDDHYLPHASAWPFAIGLGGATVANGLVLGLWVIVPGVALLALGVGGFIRQTR